MYISQKNPNRGFDLIREIRKGFPEENESELRWEETKDANIKKDSREER